MDGAEHTYCIQIIKDEVPKNDCLCEDCKFGDVYDITRVQVEPFNNQTTKSKNEKKFLNTQTGDDKQIKIPKLPLQDEVIILSNLKIMNEEDCMHNEIPQLPLEQEYIIYGNENAQMNWWMNYSQWMIVDTNGSLLEDTADSLKPLKTPRVTIQRRNRFSKLNHLPDDKDYRYGLELPVDVNHPIHGEDDVPHPTEDDVGVVQPNPADNDESEPGED
ncbi:unnamed protein product [Lactuca virosa]|uniref:Uncharacterized protein n=1 Tax=Lactuca virosa TaxID=75947 RepID=A0AAU9N0G2_9ASTR|nr:unnamed protein product [Lactuca virosa]